MPTLFIGDKMMNGVVVDDGKPEIVLGNLAASSWTDNTYSFEDNYPVDRYDIEISVDSSATEDQLTEFSFAMICGSYNSNVITAKGDVPTVDIPIIIKVVNK